MENAQFHRIASFVLATPTPYDEQDFQQEGLVPLSPSFDKLIEPFPLIRRMRKVRKGMKFEGRNY
jgi:hypothetical protein